jgi:glycosyltransferase involved in cell wall biosynthesis
VCARPSRICLVSGGRLTGDTEQRARLLTGQGFRIHVLRGDPDDVPAAFGVPNLHASPCTDLSEAVRHVLERLHREDPVDLVEFPCLGGLGFRSIQAKQAGLAFGDVRLAVRLDRCSAGVREQEQRWAVGAEDLELDFCERYAFENADIQQAPDEAMRRYAAGLGWRVRDSGEAGGPETENGTNGLPPVTVSIAHYNLGRYLPETLASLAAQTYPNLEVLVIDDGSTDAGSVAVFRDMQAKYPRFRFLAQANAGIGATRNRGLREARGDYFIPMDADNVARPDMVERFVAAMRRNPDVSTLTCYFLAFRESRDLAAGDYHYAYRPTGGPHVLASLRNVYGDANAIFRTDHFRAAGGYETDRDTSNEDWEAFVKLVNAGYRIDVLPEHLFYYRHLDSGFSRVTNRYRNHRRVLRQFFQAERLPLAERVALWTALAGCQQRLELLEQEDRARQGRGTLAPLLRALIARVPFVKRTAKRLLQVGREGLKLLVHPTPLRPRAASPPRTGARVPSSAAGVGTVDRLS